MNKLTITIEVPLYDSNGRMDTQSKEVIKHSFKQIGAEFVRENTGERGFDGVFSFLTFEFTSDNELLMNNLNLALK